MRLIPSLSMPNNMVGLNMPTIQCNAFVMKPLKSFRNSPHHKLATISLQ